MRRPLVLGCGLAALIGLLLFGAAIRNVTRPDPPVAASSTALQVPATRAPVVAFATLNVRQWLKIAKNPAAHLGEAIVVFGAVTQFDTVTGLDRFRADVGPSKSRHPTPSVLTGDAVGLAELVRFDKFQADVIVTGAGKRDGATVPQLEIRTLKML